MKTKCLVDRYKMERAVLAVSQDIYLKDRKNWMRMTEEELWNELVSCILGSRVRYETAFSAVTHLIECKSLRLSTLLANPKAAEKKISCELSKRIYEQVSNGKLKVYPFPNIKAKQIVDTALEIYKRSQTKLIKILSKSADPFKARLTLIEKCKGIGFKQSSLFLRNISYCDNLAILDSHVLRFMDLVLLDGNLKLTKSRYLFFEELLYNYALLKGVSLAVLDIAIWIVMRVVKGEFVYEHCKPCVGWN